MKTYTFQINVVHDDEFLQTFYQVTANSSEEAFQKAEEYGVTQFGYDFIEAVEITHAA